MKALQDTTRKILVCRKCLGNRRDLDNEKKQLEKEVMQLHEEVMKLNGDEEEKFSDLLKKAADHTSRIQQLEEAAQQPSSGCDFIVEKVSITTDWGSSDIHLVKDGGVSWRASAEVSSLVKEWRGWDLLDRRLRSKHLQLDKLVVANGDAKWDILVKGEVEGLKDKDGKLKDEVSLYRLDCLPQVMSSFTENCKITASSLSGLLG